MSTDVQFLVFGLIAFVLCGVLTHEQEKNPRDPRPSAGVSLAGLTSVLVILISLAHIIVRLLFGS